MGVVLECKSGTCWCQSKFMSGELLRSLPSIERLLTRPAAERAACELSRDRVRDLLREIIEEMREEVRGQESGVRAQGAEPFGSFGGRELENIKAGDSVSC